MEHSFKEHPLGTTLSVDETEGENTQLQLSDSMNMVDCSHFLSPKELSDFIGILLHIQAKKRKQFKTKF